MNKIIGITLLPFAISIIQFYPLFYEFHNSLGEIGKTLSNIMFGLVSIPSLFVGPIAFSSITKHRKYQIFISQLIIGLFFVFGLMSEFNKDQWLMMDILLVSQFIVTSHLFSITIGPNLILFTLLLAITFLFPDNSLFYFFDFVSATYLIISGFLILSNKIKVDNIEYQDDVGITPTIGIWPLENETNLFLNSNKGLNCPMSEELIKDLNQLEKRELLRLSPALYMFEKGTLLIKHGEFEMAIQLAEKCLKESAIGEGNIYFLIGSANRRNGNFAGAAKYFKKIEIEYHPHLRNPIKRETKLCNKMDTKHIEFKI
jgi:hypothetical protein